MKLPTRDEFAKLVMDRIRQAGEMGKIIYDAEEFSLYREGETLRMSLHNTYGEYCFYDADQREYKLKGAIRLWFRARSGRSKPPKDFADAKPDLLPIIRARDYFQNNSLDRPSEYGAPPIIPHDVLGEHFGIGLVYDQPESMGTISQSTLDSWRVSFRDAMQIAIGNLAAVPARFDSRGGVYWFTTSDTYDPSRLLLTKLLRQFNVRGNPIVMIPSRSGVVVAGSKDVGALLQMSQMAAAAWEWPRRISGTALRLDGDEWVPWLPNISHPAFADFQKLHYQSLASSYLAQESLLEKLHKKQGLSIFVAKFRIQQAPNGIYKSLCLWLTGFDQLLPKTDFVGFEPIDGCLRTVEWQKVMEVAGDLIEAVDIFPPLFRVREFPSEKQLAAMVGISASVFKKAE